LQCSLPVGEEFIANYQKEGKANTRSLHKNMAQKTFSLRKFHNTKSVFTLGEFTNHRVTAFEALANKNRGDFLLVISFVQRSQYFRI
jgi:hypothetical protein